MKIERIVCGAYAENAYVIDGKYMVDPGDGLAQLQMALPEPKAILLTHGHFDHMLAAESIQKTSGAMVYIHPADAGMLTDPALSAYDAGASQLKHPTEIAYTAYPEEIFGFRVLHTPGHSAGSVCLYNEAEKVLFAGDTLFRAGFGRYDLPGGDVQALLGSLRRLFCLSGDTIVYPGHGETTTIEDERRRYGR